MNEHAPACACAQWCGDRSCPGLAIPAWLRLTQEERAATWRAHPPRPMPMYADRTERTDEDEGTRELRASLERGAALAARQKREQLDEWKEKHKDELKERAAARRALKRATKRPARGGKLTRRSAARKHNKSRA